MVNNTAVFPKGALSHVVTQRYCAFCSTVSMELRVIKNCSIWYSTFLIFQCSIGALVDMLVLYKIYVVFTFVGQRDQEGHAIAW